jgi:hypothetical protein
MNKNVVKYLKEDIEARETYEKSVRELLKLLQEAYDNIRE